MAYVEAASMAEEERLRRKREEAERRAREEAARKAAEEAARRKAEQEAARKAAEQKRQQAQQQKQQARDAQAPASKPLRTPAERKAEQEAARQAAAQKRQGVQQRRLQEQEKRTPAAANPVIRTPAERQLMGKGAPSVKQIGTHNSYRANPTNNPNSKNGEFRWSGKYVDGTTQKKAADELSTAEVMAFMRTLPEKRRQSALEDFQKNDLSNPGSVFYDPYWSDASTNENAKALFGKDRFERGEIDTPENRAKLAMLDWNPGGSPKAPTKKSSKAYREAYQLYYLITEDEPFTVKAEDEFTALKGRIGEIAALNPGATPDEVLEQIDWDGYATLSKMRKSASEKLRPVNNLTRGVKIGTSHLRAMAGAALAGEDMAQDRDWLQWEADQEYGNWMYFDDLNPNGYAVRPPEDYERPWYKRADPRIAAKPKPFFKEAYKGEGENAGGGLLQKAGNAVQDAGLALGGALWNRAGAIPKAIAGAVAGTDAGQSAPVEPSEDPAQLKTTASGTALLRGMESDREMRLAVDQGLATKADLSAVQTERATGEAREGMEGGSFAPMSAATGDGMTYDELNAYQNKLHNQTAALMERYGADGPDAVGDSIQARIAELRDAREVAAGDLRTAEETIANLQAMGFEARPQDLELQQTSAARLTEIDAQIEQANADSEWAGKIDSAKADTAEGLEATRPRTRLEKALEAEEEKARQEAPIQEALGLDSDSEPRMRLDKFEAYRLQMNDDEWASLFEAGLSYAQFDAAVMERVKANNEAGGIVMLRYKNMSPEQKEKAQAENLQQAEAYRAGLGELSDRIGDGQAFGAYAQARDAYEEYIAAAPTGNLEMFASVNPDAAQVLIDEADMDMPGSYDAWVKLGRPDTEKLTNVIDLYGQYMETEANNPGMGDWIMDSMTGGQWSSCKYNPGVGLGWATKAALVSGTQQFAKLVPLIGVSIARVGHAITDPLTGQSYENDPIYLAALNAYNNINRRMANTQQYLAENATGFENAYHMAGSEATRMGLNMMTGQAIANITGVTDALNGLYTAADMGKLTRGYALVVGSPQSLEIGLEEAQQQLEAGSSVLQAYSYGLLKAFIEASTECEATDRFLTRVFGKGVTADARAACAAKTASLGDAVVNWVVEATRSMNMEGMQEVLSEIGGIGADLAVYGTTEGTTPEALAQAYFGGFATSLLTQGLTMPQSAATYVYAHELMSRGDANITKEEWIDLYNLWQEDRMGAELYEATQDFVPGRAAAGAGRSAVSEGEQAERSAMIDARVIRMEESGRLDTPPVRDADKTLRAVDERIAGAGADIAKTEQEIEENDRKAAALLQEVASGAKSALDAGVTGAMDKLASAKTEAQARIEQYRADMEKAKAERKSAADRLAAAKEAERGNARAEATAEVDANIEEARKIVEKINELTDTLSEARAAGVNEDAARDQMAKNEEALRAEIDKLKKTEFADWVWRKTSARKQLRELEAERARAEEIRYMQEQGADNALYEGEADAEREAGMDTVGAQTRADAGARIAQAADIEDAARQAGITITGEQAAAVAKALAGEQNAAQADAEDASRAAGTDLVGEQTRAVAGAENAAQADAEDASRGAGVDLVGAQTKAVAGEQNASASDAEDVERSAGVDLVGAQTKAAAGAENAQAINLEDVLRAAGIELTAEQTRAFEQALAGRENAQQADMEDTERAAGVETVGAQTKAAAGAENAAQADAEDVERARQMAVHLPDGHGYDLDYHDTLAAKASALPEAMSLEDAIKAFGKDLTAPTNIDRWLHGLLKRAKKTGVTTVERARIEAFIAKERADDQKNMDRRVAFVERLMRHAPVEAKAPAVAPVARNAGEKLGDWLNRIKQAIMGDKSSITVRTADGTDVIVGRKMVEETFSQNDAQNRQTAMNALPSVAELLKQAVYIGSHFDYSYGEAPESGTDKRAVHYYVAAQQTPEGIARVLLHVRAGQANTQQAGNVKNSLYLERAEIIAPSSPASLELDAEASRIHPNSRTAEGTTEISIPDLLAGVNLNRMKNFDGPVKAQDDGKAQETLASRAGAVNADTSAQPAAPDIPVDSPRTDAEYEPDPIYHGQVRRFSAIGKTLTKALGITKTSKFQRKAMKTGAVLGEYEKHSGVVVTRGRQAIGTLAHEVGHALFERIGALDGEMQPTDEWKDAFGSMRRNLPANFVATYVQAGEEAALYHEAGAEFVRLYLTDYNAAVNFAGGAENVRQFERALGRDQTRIMQRARVDIRHMLTAEDLDRSRAMNTSHRYDKKNGQWWDKLLTGVADKYHIFQKFDVAAHKAGYDNKSKDRQVYTALSNLAYSRDRAGGIIENALATPDGRIIAGGMSDITKRIAYADAHDFDTYLTLKHDIDRLAQDKPVYGDGRTAQDDIDQIAKMEALHPEFAQAQQDLMSWWNAFIDEWVVKPNAIPNAKETINRFRELYPNYVPTFRSQSDDADVFGEMIMSAGGALNNAGPRFRRAKGGDQAIISPIESFAIRIQEIVAGTDKVLAMRQFHEILQEVPGLGKWAREVAAPQVTDPHAQELTRVLDADGNAHYYQIMDEVMKDVLQGSSNREMGLLLRTIGKLTGVFKQLTTMRNPFFAISNAMRDYLEAYTKGSAFTPIDFTADWIKALGELAYEALPVIGKQTKNVAAYRAAGGGDASIAPNDAKSVPQFQQAMYGKYFQGAFGAIVKGKGFKAKWRGGMDGLRASGRAVGNFVDTVNNVIEGSQRLAEFERLKRRGATNAVAFRGGMDATTDFRRSGNSQKVKDAGQVFAFMNAGIQGTYSVYRMIQEGKMNKAQFAGRIAKTLTMFGAVPVLLSALIRGSGDDRDKEEYEKMAENVKADNYLIPAHWFPEWMHLSEKDGYFVKFPKPNGPLAAIGDATGRAFVEALDKAGGWEAFVRYGMGDYLGKTGENVFDSINPYSSPVFAPVLQIMMNRTWYGKPIESKWMVDENLSPELRVNDGTSSVAIWLANLPGLKGRVSPIQTEYFINQGFGVLGDLAIGDIGDATVAALTGQASWQDVGGAALGTVKDMMISRIRTDPTAASDIKSAVDDMRAVMTRITADYDSVGGSPQLNGNLTGVEMKEAVKTAEAMNKKGGLLYGIKKQNSQWYKDIEAVEAGPLSAEEKDLKVRAIKYKMLLANAAALATCEEYVKKYVKGTPSDYARLVKKGAR